LVALHLVEHAEGLFEVGVEVGAHEGEDLVDEGVADGVKHLVAAFTGRDEVLGAEDGEVLGDVGLLHFELVDEGAGGEFAVGEELEDGDAGGVGEGLEDVGFEAAEGFLHV
jgi:hypothetical protein